MARSGKIGIQTDVDADFKQLIDFCKSLDGNRQTLQDFTREALENRVLESLSTIPNVREFLQSTPNPALADVYEELLERRKVGAVS